MSVTFFHTAEPIIGGWFLQCACGKGPRFADRELAVAALQERQRTTDVWEYCEDSMCSAYDPFITPEYVGVEPLSVNLSNVNARHILGILGVHDEELFGDMELESFDAALQSATPRSGTPTLVSVLVGGEFVELPAEFAPESAPIRMVNCGRDSGYDLRVLQDLSELLSQAQELHADRICWS